MKTIGWYYLHKNGALIYKRELGETTADIRESDFALALWPVRTDDREGAWNILIEGLAAGADLNQITQLAKKWGCDNEDAAIYAARVECLLSMDGNAFCSTRKDFTNLQGCPAGFGKTALEAMASLAKELGYKPSKTWGNSFGQLLK